MEQSDKLRIKNLLNTEILMMVRKNQLSDVASRTQRSRITEKTRLIPAHEQAINHRGQDASPFDFSTIGDTRIEIGELDKILLRGL